MKSLNEEITEVIEKKRLFVKWNDHSSRLSEQIAKKQIKALELKKKLESKNESVDGILNMSVSYLMTKAAGENGEKLSHEQKETVAAKLQYQEAVLSLQELNREKEMYDEHLKQLGDTAAAFDSLEKRKEQMIQDENTVWSEKLYEVTVQEVELMGAMQELSDAVDAGEHAYYSLQETLKALDKASNWAADEALSGGMVTSYIKHSSLDDAKASIHKTERRIRQFQDELIDIEQHENEDLHIGDFLSAADYFFDELILDWIVDNKLMEATSNVILIQEEVSSFVNVLKEKSMRFEEKRTHASEERIRIIQHS